MAAYEAWTPSSRQIELYEVQIELYELPLHPIPMEYPPTARPGVKVELLFRLWTLVIYVGT